jgi:crooked neck
VWDVNLQEFEDSIRSHRYNIQVYLAYGKFEEEQREFDRARSVLERALDVDYKDARLWNRYITMELRHKFVNRARNLLDRVVALLPRIDQFWYKYAWLEEAVGNLNNARSVFERWMGWEPNDKAWVTYINFEVRAGEVDRARAVHERYIANRPTQAAYLRYAKWEEKNDQLALARRVFERSLDELDTEERDDRVFSAFAEFEARCGEPERARAVFKLALSTLPASLTREVQARFVQFEKQHGERKGIESVLLARRREEYGKAVEADRLDYDAWFDWARMEEAEGDVERIREVYERAIAALPPSKQKRHWRRYIYLWLNYAVFEELGAGDVARAREVYKTCLELVPHKIFTFAKVWVQAAHFEVRQKDLSKARRLLGRAIGVCPKPKLFKEYIALEARLQEVDRVRQLYGKFLQHAPHDVDVWTAYARMETELGETARARAIYALGTDRPVLDRPEVLWQAYIDFEVESGGVAHARALYQRLMDRTQHVRAFLDFARFEATHGGSIDNARAVLKSANGTYRETGQKEERAVVLREWLDVERAAAAAIGAATTKPLRDVEAMQPRAVKTLREVLGQDGTPAGSEEFYDYIFPEEKKATGLKLLERAKLWRAKMAADASEGSTMAAAASAGASTAPSAQAATADDDDDDDDDDDNVQEQDAHQHSEGLSGSDSASRKRDRDE